MNSYEAHAPTQRSIQTHDGFSLNVWDYGDDAPTLLLCHCTGGVSRQWDVVIRHLGGKYRIIAPDTRGHGDSQAMPDRDSCAWSLSGRDIHTILDAFGLHEPVYAVGHSAGAAHIAYAEDLTPGRFKKAMLIDAIIGPAFVFAGENPLAALSRKRRNVFENLDIARANFSAKPPMKSWVAGAVESYLEHGLRKTNEGEVALKLPGEKEAWFYEMGGACDLFERLETLAFECVLLTGSESNVAPLAQLQLEKLPNATLHTIDGASHFIPQEKPASVAALIGAFCA